jgi:lysophospholipase L1-like esterase
MSFSVICVGDSITNGSTNASMPYPQSLVFLLGPAWSVVNVGISGYSTTSMLALYNAGITGKGYNFVPIIGGVNDCLGGTASATAFANLEDMYDGCLADVDCIPIIATIMPCSAGPGWTAAAQTKIEEVNTLIRAYAAAHPSVPFWDAYVLMAQGGSPTQLAAIYSADGLHPNDAGRLFIATQVAALIQP